MGIVEGLSSKAWFSLNYVLRAVPHVAHTLGMSRLGVAHPECWHHQSCGWLGVAGWHLCLSTAVHAMCATALRAAREREGLRSCTWLRGSLAEQ
eukprot:1157260-Pelagomonas_calceolata.AAC.7